MTETTTHDEHAYESHVGDTRQYWRDIILGVNDGLVSMLLLVAGVVGGGFDTEQILLTGIAGAIAGAISMGAGEYLATKSQDEVLTAEIELEKSHIAHHRDMEVDQLRDMFSDMGLTGDELERSVHAFSANDEILLNAMKVLEFGIVDSERRSPYTAMFASSGLFLAGSASSVIPFAFVTDPTFGLVIAGVLTAIGLFTVGVIKSIVSKTNSFTSGLENLTIAGIGGVIAWWVGRIVDANLG